MDPKTDVLLKEALEEYFKGSIKGARFYVNSKLKLRSSTIQKFVSKPSRINF